MTLAEKIMSEINTLSEDKKYEVLDFVEFIKAREQREFDQEADKLISENIVALRELAK